MNARFHGWLGSSALLAALIALWWLASNAGWVSRVFLPTPQATLASLAEGLNFGGSGSGELLAFTGATVLRMIEGWLLASLFGVLLGAAIGVSPAVRAWVQPTLEFIRPLPASAIIPVAILFLGLSNQMSIAVICFGAIWPVLLGSVHGFGSVQGRLQEVAAALELTRADFLRKIALPSAVPDILSGLRISLAVSLILAVVTEMQASLPGIGRDIVLAQRNFRSADLYGGLILLGLIGLSANHALLAIERHALRWRSPVS